MKNLALSLLLVSSSSFAFYGNDRDLDARIQEMKKIFEERQGQITNQEYIETYTQSLEELNNRINNYNELLVEKRARIEERKSGINTEIEMNFTNYQRFNEKINSGEGPAGYASAIHSAVSTSNYYEKTGACRPAVLGDEYCNGFSDQVKNINSDLKGLQEYFKRCAENPEGNANYTSCSEGHQRRRRQEARGLMEQMNSLTQQHVRDYTKKVESWDDEIEAEISKLEEQKENVETTLALQEEEAQRLEEELGAENFEKFDELIDDLMARADGELMNGKMLLLDSQYLQQKYQMSAADAEKLLGKIADKLGDENSEQGKEFQGSTLGRYIASAVCDQMMQCTMPTDGSTVGESFGDFYNTSSEAIKRLNATEN